MTPPRSDGQLYRWPNIPFGCSARNRPDSLKSWRLDLVRRGRLEAAGAAVARRRGEVGRRVAGDPGCLHDPRFVEIVRPRAVHDTAVVPDYQIAGLPVLNVNARRLAGEFEQLVQQALRRIVVKPVNPVSVAADAQ